MTDQPSNPNEPAHDNTLDTLSAALTRSEQNCLLEHNARKAAETTLRGVKVRLGEIVETLTGSTPDDIDALFAALESALNVNPLDDTLESKVVRFVRGWINRSAPIVRDFGQDARLTIHLDDPGGEDDGTLSLRWRYEETVTGPRTTEDEYGRVPGEKL